MRLLVTFVYFRWLFGLGLMLQKGLHYKVFDADMIMMSMSLTIMVFSVPVDKWTDRAGLKTTMIFGLVQMLISNGLLFTIQPNANVYFLVISLFICGLSTAILIPASTSGCFRLVKPQRMGLSMGVFYTCGFLGNAMGGAIVGSFLNEQAIFYGFTMAMILCGVLALIGLVLSVTIKLEQN